VSAAITGEIILLGPFFWAFGAKRVAGNETGQLKSPHSREQLANVTACHQLPPHPSLDVDAELLPVQHHRTLRSLHTGPLDVADLVRAGELTEEDGLDREVVNAGGSGDEFSRGGRGRVLWGVGNWNGGEGAWRGRVFTRWGDGKGAGRDLP